MKCQKPRTTGLRCVCKKRWGGELYSHDGIMSLPKRAKKGRV